ncbi:MAG TPA: HNH endonuclease [Candidatus Krumholzibacteria bacterium]|nr:HNH endonuclease [Candidatus Krumholzibacteria bacterium]HPD71126.1 HNH endonuclease [Candidatus Krumholzibacteria bacterium]HRY39174.1 HNH endonuclease [Candidatus Krumholzibacteria bacterium]
MSFVPDDFRPGLSATEVDRALRGAVSAYDRARRNVALWFTDALERGLYRDLGHASMEIYAREGLGFSPGRTRQFLALARDLRRLPHLRAAVTDGRLGWTKAQEVARVVAPASEAAWVERAVALPRDELRREVATARARARGARLAARGKAAGQLESSTTRATSTRGDGSSRAAAPAAAPATIPPTTIAIQLDALELARFDALVTAARRSGAVAADATRAEIVLSGLAALTKTPQRVRRGRGVGRTHGSASCQYNGARHLAPAATVIVQRCPECDAAFALTTAGPKRLDRAADAALACDHVARDARGHNRSAVPPAVRRQVLDRDGHRCTTAGCDNTRFLEVHHVVPRAQGGTNTTDNLTTLCARCHRFAHERAPAP